ncbi:MAG: response regulator transcription factor [Thiobacillus sp.]|jgi:DNA-binding NarL/FixJ family response regulator|nr:response regulator transcription factor [Thiobacillus sp.]
MCDKISIVIADDHRLVREGMRLLLASEPDFEVLAGAGDGHEALRLARELRPDVLVLDLGLPGIDGLAVARQLIQERCPCRLLALSARMDAASVRTALAYGMSGYIPKSDDSLELISAIRTVAAGGHSYSASILHLLEVDSNQPAYTITPREREILGCVAQGLSSKQIAAQLRISVATVHKHRENLGRKLGTRNAAELAAYAMLHGMGLN